MGKLTMAQARKRVREKPEVRRARIVDEAIRIVGELGYYGFTVQALAERCGLTNAGLLHYFDSKDHLLLSVLDEIELREEEVMAPQVSLTEKQLSRTGDHNQAVVELVAAIARRSTENREQSRFLTVLHGEALEPSHPAHAWFGQRDQETVGLFTLLLGGDRPDAIVKTRHLISILRGMTAIWLRTADGFDLVAECVAATRLLLRDEIGSGEATGAAPARANQPALQPDPKA